MNRNHLPCLCALLAWLFVATPAAAQDDSALDDPYWALALMLGLGGDTDLHIDDIRAESIPLGSIDDGGDPPASVGGAVSYVHPLHRYFALGGRASLLSWRMDEDSDGKRNLDFDFALMPQARVVLAQRFELYLGLPVGLAINLLREADSGTGGALLRISSDADTGLGVSLSVLAGLRVALKNNLGLFAELGYAMHKFWHEGQVRLDVVGVPIETDGEIDIRLSQAALNLGMFF